MTNEERIKADAEHNEKVFEDTMQRILNIASWADDPYKSTLIRVVSTAKEQWKSGKGKEAKVYRPCPYCGKELFRDRNLCCRACGKEVGDEICGICKDKPMGDGLTVCNECYEKFDGDRRGFWKGDVYQ